MKSKITALLLLYTSVSLLFFTGNVFALTLDSSYKTMNITLNNPGARAMGMGGAFIGVADDATAAYTNPAGLTILTKPEIAAEYKYTKYETTAELPTLYTLNYSEVSNTNTVSGFSFLSFAYPTEKVAITIFRHELVNLDTDIPTGYLPNTSNSNYRLQVNTYGVATGIKLAKSLSLGINISFSEMDQKYLPSSYLARLPSSDATKDIAHDNNDTKTHCSIGLLWNPFSEFQVGAVYRYGPEFKYNYIDYTYNNYTKTGNNIQYEDNLKIPDSYGLGFSYRFFNALTLAADINYIKYSQVMSDFKVDSFRAVLTPGSDFKSDDTLEVNVGLEYVFPLAAVPVAVRAGYHYAPSHTAYYDGPLSGTRELLPEGDDEHIFSAGVGAVLGKNLQVDLAGSWSDVRQEYIVSLVYRF